MAMNDRDVLGRDWDAMVRDMERSRRLEPRRMPWISAKQPYTKVEEAPDPDEMVLDLILGKGTGDWKKDLAFGLMGPAGGAATELSGGQSGVLDWLPGGGALKGMAVLAVPKLSHVVRAASKTTGQDLGVDALRGVAQNAVNRLAKVSDHIVTPDEIRNVVFEEADKLGDIADLPRIKNYATTIAQDVLQRANDAISSGGIPDLVIRSIPKEMNIGYKSTEASKLMEQQASTIQHNKERRQMLREAYASMSEQDKKAVQDIIEKKKREYIDRQLANGLTQEVAAKKLSNANTGIRNSAIDEFLNGPAKKRTFVPLNNIEHSDEVRAAARDAYATAKEEALAAGLSDAEAKRVASIASDRVAADVRTSLGGKYKESVLTRDKARSNNVYYVFDLLEPDIQAEINAKKELAREAARKQYENSGATKQYINTRTKSAAAHAKEKEINNTIKAMGFTGFGDPRLAQYSQLRRDGNHVLATQPVQPAMAEAAAPVKGYVADVVEGAGKSMLDGIPDEEVEALLREYGETPTADRVFNREYLEELLREEGY